MAHWWDSRVASGDTLEALCCVFEQDTCTFFFAKYLFNPGSHMTEKLMTGM